jgi:NAD(P)-dependent dehydrogenase (short-subunit alcohol dehydrogenase family)
MRVVITGASAGIGHATAMAFARRGARVALLARGEAGLLALSRQVQAAGGQALVLPTDVADVGQVEAAAARVEQAWGGIDVWVNNAMASEFAPVDRMTPADYRRVTDVSYLGAVWGTQAALRRMRPCDRGVVIQVGSALAYRSIPLQAAYCGAKSALRAFTDAQRCELLHEHSRVRLCFVVLSAFNTPQFDWARTIFPRSLRPVGRPYQPELAAQAIVWLAEHPRRELIVGWPAWAALWGQRLVPGWLDHRMARQAWEGQFGDEPGRPERPDNLYAPVDANPGARGRFSSEAKSGSVQLALTKHRGILAAAAMALLVMVPLLRKRR